MGEVILMHVGGDGDGLVKVAEVARIDLTERPPRRFVLFPGRVWLHVGERLSNGQLTARWSKNTIEGAWFTAEGWKRPNRRGRLGASQAADIERLIEGAPTESEEKARLARLIERMREEDREFITEETVAEFGGVCTIEAREALRSFFGDEWLARTAAPS